MQDLCQLSICQGVTRISSHRLLETLHCFFETLDAPHLSVPPAPHIEAVSLNVVGVTPRNLCLVLARKFQPKLVRNLG